MAGLFARTVSVATLAGALSFGVAGCKGKEDVQEQEQVQKVKHFSELFPFKRDKATGKIFIGVNRDKHEQGIKDLALSWDDIRRLYSWEDMFNRKANQLEQVEINTGDLPSPQEGVEQNVIFPQDNFVYYWFTEMSSKGPEKDFTFIALPYTSYMREHKLPLAMTIKDDLQFKPESLALTHYVDKIYYPRDEYLHPGNVVKTGLSFKVEVKRKEGKTTTNNVIVSLDNLPLTIDTGNKMYVIGLDKVKVKEGNISTVVVVR